jgi:hypothetical protein
VYAGKRIIPAFLLMMVHMVAKEIVLGIFLLPLMYMLVKELFSRFYYDGVYACKRNNSLFFLFYF